ncbi:MFS transporter [Seiridium cupressi]
MAGHNANSTSLSGAEIPETTPLLQAQVPVEAQPVYHHRRRVIVITFTMFFFLEIGANLLLPATTVALEQKICNEQYANLDPNHRDCKAAIVQGAIAVLKGWQTTLDCVPGLFATVPYGILSDKWGRHRILSLAFTGITLGLAFQLMVLYFQVFPSNLVLVSPLFMFMGGGPAVITAMLYTSIADITPVSARGPIFLQLSGLLILAEVASGPIAGLILLKSTWGLISLSSAFYVLATITTFLLPNTLHNTKARDHHDNSHQPTTDGYTSNNAVSTFTASYRKLREGFKEIRSFLGCHGVVVALMFAYVLVSLSKLVQVMLWQYTTKRYDWTWSKASFLLTIRSIVSLIVLIIVLPVLSQFLVTKLKISAKRRDVWIASVTGLAGVIGTLLIAFAPTSEVLILGLVTLAVNGGMPPVIRSLLSDIVEPRSLGTMNSLVGILEMLGLMISAPTLFGCLRLGFELGGNWIGLPFMCAAAMITISITIVWFSPIKEQKGAVEDS